MRGEGDDKKNQDGRTYLYKKCYGCGAKMHIYGKVCLNCGVNYWEKCWTGEWPEVIYSSHNPEDAIYSMPMNRVEKCMKCRNVLERGTICRPKFCFATSKGKCENCKTFDPIIFDCCQEIQKAEGVVNGENIETLSEALRKIIQQKKVVPGQAPKPPTNITNQQEEFDDDIPF